MEEPFLRPEAIQVRYRAGYRPVALPAGSRREVRVGRSVLFLNWRDPGNPLGGGSERYLHRIAGELVAGGDSVTVRTAAYPGAPAEGALDGVRYVRRGTPNSVFPTALADLARGRLGRPDVVVDCQNGVPFFGRLGTRAPVVVLVHHVHREQWRVAVGPVAGRVGWALESRVAPRVQAGCQYVAVSASTRRELLGLGVQPNRIAVVHNGLDPLPPGPGRRSPSPQLVVLGRLVPHKRVEHAVQVLARLLPTVPDLRLAVVGDGWWGPRVAQRVAELGVGDRVDLLGHVDEATKHALLAQSWLHLCPSVKEGWGLSILEAAQHGVPTVAYRQAGGTADAVVDGQTGLLVEDTPTGGAGDTPAGLTRATARLLGDSALRERLGRTARARSTRFTWQRSAAEFGRVLDAVLAGRRLPGPPSAAAVLDQRLLHGGGVGRGLLGERDDAVGGPAGDGGTDDERDGRAHQGPHDHSPHRHPAAPLPEP